MDYPGKVITKNQVTPTQTSATGVWTLDDAAAATRNNNWPVAGVPNPISKSLRFNSADSAYLNRTPASAGNRKTWTWSGWVKRGALGTAQWVLAVGGSTEYTIVRFNATDTLEYARIVSSAIDAQKISTAVYRDPSAWYHIVIVEDALNTVARIYVNGSEVAYSTNDNPSNVNGAVNNTVVHTMSGVLSGVGTNYFNGYMTEVNFIDGQALTQFSFGMTDPITGVWEPLKYSGTYGTNGFYLNFKDATSTTTLGYDYSGNANNWTANGFVVTPPTSAGNDSLTDVPTPWVAYNTTGDVGGVVRGNYATLNPIVPPSARTTLSNGNLQVVGSSSVESGCDYGTVGVSSGKWYWENTVTAISSASSYPNLGSVRTLHPNSNGKFIGDNLSQGFGIFTNGNVYRENSLVTTTTSYTTNDVIGIGLDLDNLEAKFYKNGSLIYTLTGLTAGTYWIGIASYYNSNTALNAGQRPFAYTPPSGFLSLCTTNLPASTIVQGNQYFDTTIYTGNNTAGRNITNSGSFQPDFVWIKNRSGTNNHILTDVVRGATKTLFSDSTSAELTVAGALTAFNSNGFQVGYDGTAIVNASANNYVGWQWKANGAGVNNTVGQITSTVSANNDAGFSIVTFTGNGSANQTVGHGCKVGGVATAPAFGILKDRDTNSNNNQLQVFHTAAGDKYAYLSTTAAFAGTAEFYPTTSSTTTVTVGRGSPVATTNESGDNYVMYLFAPVAGYSAFGSYTGNGAADGPFVYTGFRPRYLMVKNASNGTADAAWVVIDSARSDYNQAILYLVPNTSGAEASSTGVAVDFTSNGFKIRNTSTAMNASTNTIIYAAFAESPFKYSLAR